MRYVTAALWGTLGAVLAVYVMISVYGTVYERTHQVVRLCRLPLCRRAPTLVSQ